MIWSLHGVPWQEPFSICESRLSQLSLLIISYWGTHGDMLIREVHPVLV